MTEDRAIDIALQQIQKGRCTIDTLKKQKVPLEMVYSVMQKAEARFVNDALRMFPPPRRNSRP